MKIENIIFCLLAILGTIFSGCASSTKDLHKIVKVDEPKLSNRGPSSKELNMKDSLSETRLLEDNFKNMKPLDILEYLKNECCENRIVPQFEVKNIWTDEDIENLKEYLNDTSEASSVSRPTSSVHCQGEKYQSTTEREAYHLMEAYKRGVYPVAQCSTYDFKYKK